MVGCGYATETARFLSHFRDSLECRVLPRVAGILPWRYFFPLARFLCSFPYLFQAEARASLAGAKAFGYVDSAFVWLSNHRFVRLVDQVDASISAHCEDSWLDQHLVTDGEWPTAPFVGITFHFGAGLWAIRHLRRKAIRSSFLSAPLHPEIFPEHPLRYAFEVGRMAETERISGKPIIYVGGSFKKLQAALAEGTSIIGLIDVLAQFVPSTQSTKFLGHPSRFPNGLIDLARHCEVPWRYSFAIQTSKLVAATCLYVRSIGTILTRSRPSLAPWRTRSRQHHGLGICGPLRLTFLFCR